MSQNNRKVWYGIILSGICASAILLAILLASQFDFIGLAFPELLTGWFRFAVRVVPKAKIHWDGVVIFIIGAMIACVLTHNFLRWLVHESQTKRNVTLSPWRFASSVSLVAIVLLIFAIGVSMAGIVHQVGWLINSPEGLFLKEVQTEKDAMRSPYRPGVVDSDNQRSWLFHSMPYLPYVQPELNRAEPWNGESNLAKSKGLIADVLCPSQGYPHKSPDGLGLTHVVGNKSVTEADRTLRLQDIEDSSQTIWAGEVQVGFSPWAMPRNGRLTTNGIRRDWSGVSNELLGFGSAHTAGANIIMMDASVQFLSDKTDARVLEQLGRLKLNDKN